jgi:hypothetical protein
VVYRDPRTLPFIRSAREGARDIVPGRKPR